LLHELFQTGDNLGILNGDIPGFGRVLFQIVQFSDGSLGPLDLQPDRLPFSLPDGHGTILFMKLPVQEIVRLLLTPAQQGGQE
jgi:hypothetical protein